MNIATTEGLQSNPKKNELILQFGSSLGRLYMVVGPDGPWLVAVLFAAFCGDKGKETEQLSLTRCSGELLCLLLDQHGLAITSPTGLSRKSTKYWLQRKLQTSY